MFCLASIKGRRCAPHARPVLAALGCGLRVSLDEILAGRIDRAHVGALRMLRLAQNARNEGHADASENTNTYKRNQAARYFVADLSNEIARQHGAVAEEAFLRAIGFEYLLEE